MFAFCQYNPHKLGKIPSATSTVFQGTKKVKSSLEVKSDF